MIWATVRSWSHFCWLYRASPSLTAKNIINPVSVLTIWWCPCVESSRVLLEEGVCYDQCVLLAKLLAFALLHFVLQGQRFLLLRVSLDFLLLHLSPLWWKGHRFRVLVLAGLVGIQSVLNIHWKDWFWSWNCNIWQPDVKNWLIGKDPDAGKDRRQEEKGKTEDKMVGWHHQLNRHETEQTPGEDEGQGRLVCCSPWSCKVMDVTEQLNNNNNSQYSSSIN